MSLATLVNATGHGLWLAGSALYFTRGVGLPVAQVGLGLTLAGVAGLLATVPLGQLADRRGPRELLVLLLGLEGLAVASYLLVDSFAAFVLVTLVASICQGGSAGVRGALIAQIAGATGRAVARARLRAVTNVGISVGAALAGFALQADTRLAYDLLAVGNTVTFWLAALAISRLPRVPPPPVPTGQRRLLALRDRPFTAVTALNGVLSLQYDVLVFAMPLWVVGRTEAPRWLVSVLLLVNTAMIVLLQVRAARNVETADPAARTVRRGSYAFAVAAVLFALSAGLSPVTAVLLLLLAAVVHTVGELWHAAGAFGLSYDLAPDHAMGQYQGVFSLGMGASRAFAPGLLTLLLFGIGRPGWFVLAAVFVAAGLALPLVARWAVATREPQPLPPTTSVAG